MKIVRKTISYRIISFILLFAIIYAFTGSIGETTILTIFVECIKALTYYIFEHIWRKLCQTENT